MTGSRGIVERADSIRSAIEGLPGLREAAKNSAAVATRATQLGGLASSLRRETARLRLFRERGLQPFIPPERPAELLAATMEHRARFQEDRTTIASDPSDSDFKWRYRDDLERLSRLIERALRDAWQSHLDSLVPAALDERLGLLERVPALRQRVAQARELRAGLDEARNTIPGDASDFDGAEAAARALRESLGSLSEVPEEVQQFLLAASSSGAPPDTLTPTVRAWLDEHDLAGSLRYVLRGGP